MNSLPLLYSSAMVPPVLVGTKTQTRRALKLQPDAMHDGEPYWFIGGYRAWGYRPAPAVPHRAGGNPMPCPYGAPGDHLWGKETFFAWGRWVTRFSVKKGRDEWHFVDMTLEYGRSYAYDADPDTPMVVKRRSTVVPLWWRRPAIFMPRAASRITLEITEVRVERLQDISDADAKAEGADCLKWSGIEGTAADLIDWPLKEVSNPHRNGFAVLWESINGDGSWAANPWVWVVSFRRLP